MSSKPCISPQREASPWGPRGDPEACVLARERTQTRPRKRHFLAREEAARLENWSNRWKPKGDPKLTTMMKP